MEAVLLTPMAATLRVQIVHQTQYRQLKAQQSPTAIACLVRMDTPLQVALYALLIPSHLWAPPAARTACVMLAFMGPTAARVRSVLSARTKQARVMRLVNHALAILFRPLAARAQVTVYVHFRWLNQGRVQSQLISNLWEALWHAQW